MSVDESRAWLEKLPGVEPKTSAAVLSFSNSRLRALQVDSHHHRVAQRLGLVDEKKDVGPALKILEVQLPKEWTAQEVYDNHEALMLHGQKCCYFKNSDCRRCVVLKVCPFGQSIVDSHH